MMYANGSPKPGYTKRDIKALHKNTPRYSLISTITHQESLIGFIRETLKGEYHYGTHRQAIGKPTPEQETDRQIEKTLNEMNIPYTKYDVQA